jgi:hypothetical protein
MHAAGWLEGGLVSRCTWTAGERSSGTETAESELAPGERLELST